MSITRYETNRLSSVTSNNNRPLSKPVQGTMTGKLGGESGDYSPDSTANKFNRTSVHFKEDNNEHNSQI